MQGRPFYIIKDPVTGQFFRFREVECFIARQFDGENSLDTIRERAEQKFQASLDEESLAEFINTLRGYGLLEKTNGGSEHATGEKPPVTVTGDESPADDFD